MNREYQLRFVFIDNLTTVYVDERHATNRYIGEVVRGAIALSAADGPAQFRDISFWEPKPDK